MSDASGDRSGDQPPLSSGLRGSVLVLLLGVVLAVAVSKLLDLLGWGGELAGQAAGAASGAAPVLIDSLRRRDGPRRPLRISDLTRPRVRRPPLLVASVFGFLVLLVDSLLGFLTVRTTKEAIRVAGGDPGRWVRANAFATAVLDLPIMLVLTAALAAASAHRIATAKKRWIWLGLAVYAAVRIGMLVDPGDRAQLGLGVVGVVLAALLTAGLLGLAAMVGVWWAGRTQPSYDAVAFFRRLGPDDQRAVLALLAEDDPATPGLDGRSSDGMGSDGGDTEVRRTGPSRP